MTKLKPRREPEAGEKTSWVPDRTAPQSDHQGRYQGNEAKKPWDYACEVSIPALDTPDTLWYVIQLLRLQTARPFISIIDTGSTPAHAERIMAMADSPDVEVHSLRFKAVRHPSDFPAVACDAALSMCRSEFLFLTHADVFLRRRDFLEEMLGLCSAENPAVGYQMSPRAHEGWEKMVSHTATMLHMPTMWRIGAGYSLARLCSNTGIEHRPNSVIDNWPDTESLLSVILQANDIKPLLIGAEPNQKPTIDGNIYHCRSLTAGRLYAPIYAAECQKWVDEATEEARRNINAWTPQALP